MSGFIGCIHDNPKQYTDEEKQNFKKMTRLISHRGPDDEGFYFDEYAQLGYRSLYINHSDKENELSTFDNDRYLILFNGKILNNEELREELTEQGIILQTQSDSELLIALYAAHKEKLVEKLRGMFAFLIWDKNEKNLFGARDHFGSKPMFYFEDGDQDRIFFASEKKSILLALEEEEMDEEALHYYLTFQFAPEPYTFTKGIHKLLPGHYFFKAPGKPLKIEKYWQVHFKPVQKTEEQWIKEIQDALIESVKINMRGEASIGAFLSGGIDSTMVTSIAKEIHPEIETFSVGFEREGFSEIDVAKETADKLGLKNNSYIIQPDEFMEAIPRIMWYTDDPLADPAMVPQYFAAKLASQHVKVILSGEGSDELFGGYNIYREPQSLAIFDRIPGFLKAILRAIARILPEGVKGKSFIERGTTPLEERFVGNAKIFLEPEKKLLLANYQDNLHYTDITKPFYRQSASYSPVSRMQYIDIHTWLTGDILLNADRMMMAHSLDVRVPFLDTKVFEVAAGIPDELKTAHGTTKYILRRAAEGIIPEHVLNRKKLGFPVPIRHWLKDEMYDWARNIINESQTDQYINKQYVLNLLEEHRTGKFDHSRKIWTVLCFMIWYAVYFEKKYSFEEEVLREKALV